MFCSKCGTELKDNVCPNCGYHEPEAQAKEVSEAPAAESVAAQPAETQAAASGMTETVSSEAAAAETAEPAAPEVAAQQTAAPNAGEIAQPYADTAPNAGQPVPPYTPPAQPYTPPAGQPYAYGQPGQGYAPYGAPAAAADDKKSTGLNVLSFFFPVIGLIIYLVTKKDKPVRAKSMGKSALGGFITWFVLTVILTILLVALGMYGFSVLQEETGGSFEAPYITSQDGTVIVGDDFTNDAAFDWQNMVVVINGVEVNLPCTYSEFTQKTGFALEPEQLNEQLEAKYYSYRVSVENLLDQEIDIRFYNVSETTAAVQDCLVVGVAVDAEYDGSEAVIVLPQNVQVGGVYDPAALRAAFGEPTDTYTGTDGYATMTWQDDYDTYNTLEITTYDGQTIEEIAVDAYPVE